MTKLAVLIASIAASLPCGARGSAGAAPSPLPNIVYILLDDLWDGGRRIPLIARWPGKTPAGSRCDQLVCLTDLMTTCAEIVKAKLPENAGEDSVSMLPLLLGSRRPTRANAIHHSITGKFSLREGKWKLLVCAGSGGWSEPDDPQSEKLGLPDVQLYDMQLDRGERTNLQARFPNVAARLLKELTAQVAAGRSTPGPPQKNDVRVDIWKRPGFPRNAASALWYLPRKYVFAEDLSQEE